jgi:hypothetical protein
MKHLPAWAWNIVFYLGGILTGMLILTFISIFFIGTASGPSINAPIVPPNFHINLIYLSHLVRGYYGY